MNMVAPSAINPSRENYLREKERTKDRDLKRAKKAVERRQKQLDQCKRPQAKRKAMKKLLNAVLTLKAEDKAY